MQVSLKIADYLLVCYVTKLNVQGKKSGAELIGGRTLQVGFGHMKK